MRSYLILDGVNGSPMRLYVNGRLRRPGSGAAATLFPSRNAAWQAVRRHRKLYGGETQHDVEAVESVEFHGPFVQDLPNQPCVMMKEKP